MIRFQRVMDNATPVIIMCRAHLSKRRMVGSASFKREIFVIVSRLTYQIQRNVSSVKRTIMWIQKINAQFVHLLTEQIQAARDARNQNASNAWTVMPLVLMVGAQNAQCQLKIKEFIILSTKDVKTVRVLPRKQLASIVISDGRVQTPKLQVSY